MHQLEEKIAKAKSAGRTAVIPFITAGFPNPAKFWECLEEMDSRGADIIEIGVPFSDPVADGPVVEEASRRALAQGITLKEILLELGKRRGKFQAGLILMGYYNPFFQYGLENLARDAAMAGVGGLIIPDLPIDESTPIKNVLEKYNIALIPLVGPNTSLERMKEYARDAQGYAYVVSVMGITGERKKLAGNVADTLIRARKAFAIPLALGFGLSRPEQLEVLPEEARPDAAVIGSAILKEIDNGGSAGAFLAKWL